MRRLKTALSVIILLFVFCSCTKTSETQTMPGGTPTLPSTTTSSPSATQPQEVDLIAENFVIVFNEDNDSDRRLKNLLNMKMTMAGISLASAPETAEPSDNEILLTNVSTREESLAFYDRMTANLSEHIGAYAILFDGDKIVLAASCRDAELLVVEKLMSFYQNGKFVISKGISDVTYFDLQEYNRSGNIISWEEDVLASATHLVKVSVPGYEEIRLKADQNEYNLQYDITKPMPSADTIELIAYHPDIVCGVAFNDNKAIVSVTSRDGSVTKEYKINFQTDGVAPIAAEIVNKNGAKGVLTLLSDDGDQRTADYFYSVIAPKYSAFKITIAIPTRNIASLTKTSDGSAWLKGSDGKYSLTILKNTYTSSIPGSVFRTGSHPTMVDFWKEIVSCDSIVLASHSHTHERWGVTDEQNGSYPQGNVIKELHASAQILQDLLGQENSFFIRPGGNDDFTSDYFYDLVESDPTYLGMRTTSSAPPLPGSDWLKLNSVEKFKNPSDRLKINTILARGYEAAFNEEENGFANKSGDSGSACIASGISAWQHYIELAMEYGQWASIGFHYLSPNNTSVTGYSVVYSQFEALMDYVQPLVENGDLWLPTFAEAAKYYFEWSSAELSAICYGNECISLTLDDAESDPRFDEKLTVKVSIPYSWTSAILESYGETESLTIHTAEDGSHFVYANILPGIGNSIIRPAT